MCKYQPFESPTATKMSDLTLSPTPPPTFHLFSLLYTELRFKIWKYALEPRIVSIRYNPTSRKCESPTPLPALLHVNRESRYETLRLYPLLFATPTAPSHIPFNPMLDTPYFPRRGQMGYDETLRDFRTFLANPSDLNIVRRVALDSVDTKIKRPWESYDKAVLIKSFPKLEEVKLVLKRERVAWLSNIPRPMGPVREENNARIEFVEYEDQMEAEHVKTDFKMAFQREEEALRYICAQQGMEYELCTLPPVVVVAKKVVDERSTAVAMK